MEIPRNETCGSYFKLLFQFIKKKEYPTVFLQGCCLLKMDASSTDFQQFFKKLLLRNRVNASR